MDQTTTRLRKAFQYKNDSDSDDSLPEAMDEEEQTNLISTLASQNASTNQIYTNLFLVVVLFCTIPYYLPLFQPSTSLFSILALSSLAASAYILHSLPNGSTGIPLLDGYVIPKRSASKGGDGKAQMRAPQLGERIDKGPLEVYLPLLNLVLVGFCAILAVVVKNQAAGAAGGGLVMALLPGVIFGVVCAIKVVMGSVDVKELDELRYGYKGA